MEATTKEKAVIFDIDGTLAHMEGRIARFGKKAAPYLDEEAYDDSVDEHIKYIAEKVSEDFKIIICSGRHQRGEGVLVKWLNENNIPWNNMFMRRDDDNRKDSIVKREIYEKFIEPIWDVWLVVDDRDQVVDMWRNELGLKCLQVADGGF